MTVEHAVTDQTPTRYQRTHQPVHVSGIMCTSRKPLQDDRCPDCSRHLAPAGSDHLPDTVFALGRIDHYADGSQLVVFRGGR